MKLLQFIILLILSENVYSQNKICNCTLKGVVHDQEKHLPIIGAVLYLKGTNISVFTDSRGVYQFNNLCKGEYILICKALSFDVTELKINLQDVHNQDIDLLNNDEHLQEVVVSSQKTSIANKSVLSGKSLEETRGQSLGEALKNISGVTTLQTGSFVQKPVINGMHSNRVIVLNNGIRQEGQQWGSEHAPEIDPFVAKKMTVIKGVAGLRYGSDAIGGIVMVEPDNLPDSSNIHGEINIVGFSNGLQRVGSSIIEGGLKGVKGLGWRVQGTYKRGGNISTATYSLVNTGIQERNFSVGIGLNKIHFGTELFYSYFDTQIGVFTGSHIGNIQDLARAISKQKPDDAYTPSKFSEVIEKPNQDVSHHLLKVKSFFNNDYFGKLTFVGAYQYNWRLEYDIPRGNRSLNTLNFKLDTYAAEIIFDHLPVAQLFNGSVGINAQYQQNLSSSFELTKPLTSTTLLPNYQTLNFGIFVNERYVSHQWETEFGVRYDHRILDAYSLKIGGISEQNKFSFSNFSGASGIKYHHSENWESNMNFGVVWRSPSVNELFTDGIHHGSASYEKGDLNLTPEVAQNVSLGTIYKGKKMSFEISAYLKNIQNFIYLKPRIQNDTLRNILTVRGAFPAFDYTQVDARFWGVDLTFIYGVMKNFDLTSKFSIVRAKDTRNNLFMVNIPSDRIDNSLQYNFRKQNAYISFNHQFIAKQNRVEANSDFLVSPDAYNLFSFRSGLTLNHLSIGITVSNLLNQSYREYLNRFRYFTDDMGRNVSLRLNYKF